MKKSTVQIIVAAFMVMVLSACGGGGGGGVPGNNTVRTTAYIKSFNTGTADRFGTVALSGDGNTMVVGAYGEASSATGVNGNMADDTANASGAAYVYVRDPGTGLWSEQAYLKASNAKASDFFGMSLSISADGNTLAVGAHWEDSNATGVNGSQNNSAAAMSGAVYVFVRSGTLWSQQAYVKASNTETGDLFGSAVALSGDGSTLAVGAPREDSSTTGAGGNQSDNSAGDGGAVYIFTRNTTSWSQQAYLKSSNTGTNDKFGSSLALSTDGNTLAVGAPFEDSSATGIGGNQADNSAADSGAVYVFTRSSGTWSQQAYVKASNTGAGDQFGTSVSLSGDGSTLAVGAFGEASNATGVNGVGTDNSAAGSGAAYVFVRTSGVWSQQAYLKSSNTGTGDNFGSAISLSGDGNTLAVGAKSEDSNATGIGGDQTNNSAADSGAAYVFKRSAGVWSQQSYVKAFNTESGDTFGEFVSLSSDGAMLACSSTIEGSNASGVGGNQTDNSFPNSGAVYVYPL